MKILSLALAVLMILSLSACGGNAGGAQSAPENVTTPAADESRPAETGEEIPPSPLEKADFGGYTLRVMTNINDGQSWDKNEMFAEELSGEILNDTVFERNSYIIEKYDLSGITVSNTDSSFGPFTRSVKAGDDEFDIVMPGSVNGFVWGAQGYLTEIHELPVIDLSNPWWQDFALADTSVGGKNYFLLGDMNILAYDSTACMFFNKKMIETYGMESPYLAVREGVWTFDRMEEMGRQVTFDVNGDNAYDGSDSYGLGVNSYAALTMTYGGGLRFAVKDSGDIPEFVVEEPALTYIQKFINSIRNGGWAIYGEDYGDQRITIIQSCFSDNRLLFLNEMLNRTSILRDMESDFGVLPMPKKDESQDGYYSFIHQSCSSVTVFPVTITNPEIVCTIAEDMAYYSHYYLYPAYIDSCVKTKFLRDEDSAEMVDILLNGIRFDIALLSGSSAIDDLRTLLTKRNENVASEFAKKESKYVSQFEKKLADMIG